MNFNNWAKKQDGSQPDICNDLVNNLKVSLPKALGSSLRIKVDTYDLSSKNLGNVYDIQFLESKQRVLRLSLHQVLDNKGNKTFTLSEEIDSELQKLCDISTDLQSIGKASRLIVGRLGDSLHIVKNPRSFFPSV